MLGLAGVTAIEVSAAAVTVSVVVPTHAAVGRGDRRASPWPAPRPGRSLVIVATAVFDDAQVTDAVRLAVVPSV